ncbi:MAG: tRNA (adenosine(37)-N6)-dimethylallyltransferase MiaA, partial [Bacteriovoracaceae bacterium]
MSKPIIVITGPTASGKTSLSFAVTKNFPSEIICADSMTVYQGMDIGTDKPGRNVKNRIPDIRTREKKEFQVQNLNTGIKHKNKNSEQSLKIINGIPHHLLDIVTPNQEFNVTFFKKLANEKIKEIHKRGNIPFVVGGSTLYIDTLVYDFQIPQVEPDLNLRKKLEKKTNPELFRELVSLDPDVEWTIDRNNKRRLIRALEVCHISGQPFTRQKHKKELGSNILYLSVEKERKELYKN